MGANKNNPFEEFGGTEILSNSSSNNDPFAEFGGKVNPKQPTSSQGAENGVSKFIAPQSSGGSTSVPTSTQSAFGETAKQIGKPQPTEHKLELPKEDAVKIVYNMNNLLSDNTKKLQVAQAKENQSKQRLAALDKQVSIPALHPNLAAEKNKLYNDEITAKQEQNKLLASRFGFETLKGKAQGIITDEERKLVQERINHPFIANFLQSYAEGNEAVVNAVKNMGMEDFIPAWMNSDFVDPKKTIEKYNEYANDKKKLIQGLEEQAIINDSKAQAQYEREKELGKNPVRSYLGNTFGSLTAPLILAAGSAATGTEGALPAMNGAFFGTLGYGSSLAEGYNEARKLGYSEEESYELAKNAARIGGTIQGVLGMVMGQTGEELSKLNPYTKAVTGDITKNAIKQGITDFGLKSVGTGTEFSGARLAENIGQKYLNPEVSENKDVTEGVGESFGEGLLLHTTMAALSAPKLLGKASLIKSVDEAKTPEDVSNLLNSIQQAKESNLITEGTATQLVEKVGKVKEAINLVPDSFTDSDVREKATDLILRHQAVEEKLKKTPDGLKPLVEDELKAINVQFEDLRKEQLEKQKVAKKEDAKVDMEQQVEAATTEEPKGVGEGAKEVSQKNIDKINYTLRDKENNVLVRLPLSNIETGVPKGNVFAEQRKGAAQAHLEGAIKGHDKENTATQASLDKDGNLFIADGRHRIEAQKDSGVKYGWFEVPKEQVKQIESKYETTPNEEVSNLPHTAGYSTIALDYLFTGGKNVIQSTDYLMQALVGGFEKASKEIDEIRNRYANKLGNLKEDINSDAYKEAMREIRGVINKKYNNAKAEELFDKILNNATGFTSREGNQVSIELEDLNNVAPTTEKAEGENAESQAEPIAASEESPVNLEKNGTKAETTKATEVANEQLPENNPPSQERIEANVENKVESQVNEGENLTNAPILTEKPKTENKIEEVQDGKDVKAKTLVDLIKEASENNAKKVEVIFNEPYNEAEHGNLPEKLKESLKGNKKEVFDITEEGNSILELVNNKDVKSIKYISEKELQTPNTNSNGKVNEVRAEQEEGQGESQNEGGKSQRGNEGQKTNVQKEVAPDTTTPVSKESVKNKAELSKVLEGYGYKPKFAKLQADLFDIRAKVWAKATGKTKEDYYNRFSFTNQSEKEGLNQIIGEKGTSRLENAEQVLSDLSVAKEMEKAGKSEKEIWMATSWQKGVDGKWRYETIDKELSFDKESLTNFVENNRYKFGVTNLSSLLSNSVVTKAYPQLSNLKVEITNEKESGIVAFYSPQQNTIRINLANIENGKDVVRGLQGILLHETQHAIQYIEGFQKGGNPQLAKQIIFNDVNRLIKEQNIPNEKIDDFLESYLKERFGDNHTRFDYIAYTQLAGEVEARNVQERLKLSGKERKEKMLSETEDVAREHQIVLRDALFQKANLGTHGRITFGDKINGFHNAVISIFNNKRPDTFIHEFSHANLQDIISLAQLGDEAAIKDLRTSIEFFNENSKEKLDVDKTLDDFLKLDMEKDVMSDAYVKVHENFVNGFVKYMADPESKNIPEKIKAIYDKMLDFLKEVLDIAMVSDIHITPEMEQVFGRLFGEQYVELQKENKASYDLEHDAIPKRKISEAKRKNALNNFNTLNSADEEYTVTDVLKDVINDLLEEGKTDKSIVVEQLKDYVSKNVEDANKVKQLNDFIDANSEVWKTQAGTIITKGTTEFRRQADNFLANPDVPLSTKEKLIKNQTWSTYIVSSFKNTEAWMIETMGGMDYDAILENYYPLMSAIDASTLNKGEKEYAKNYLIGQKLSQGYAKLKTLEKDYDNNANEIEQLHNELDPQLVEVITASTEIGKALAALKAFQSITPRQKVNAIDRIAKEERDPTKVAELQKQIDAIKEKLKNGEAKQEIADRVIKDLEDENVRKAELIEQLQEEKKKLQEAKKKERNIVREAKAKITTNKITIPKSDADKVLKSALDSLNKIKSLFSMEAAPESKEAVFSNAVTELILYHQLNNPNKQTTLRDIEKILKENKYNFSPEDIATAYKTAGESAIAQGVREAAIQTEAEINAWLDIKISEDLISDLEIRVKAVENTNEILKKKLEKAERDAKIVENTIANISQDLELPETELKEKVKTENGEIKNFVARKFGQRLNDEQLDMFLNSFDEEGRSIRDVVKDLLNREEARKDLKKAENRSVSESIKQDKIDAQNKKIVENTINRIAKGIKSVPVVKEITSTDKTKVKSYVSKYFGQNLNEQQLEAFLNSFDSNGNSMKNVILDLIAQDELAKDAEKIADKIEALNDKANEKKQKDIAFAKEVAERVKRGIKSIPLVKDKASRTNRDKVISYVRKHFGANFNETQMEEFLALGDGKGRTMEQVVSEMMDEEKYLLENNTSKEKVQNRIIREALGLSTVTSKKTTHTEKPYNWKESVSNLNQADLVKEMIAKVKEQNPQLSNEDLANIEKRLQDLFKEKTQRWVQNELHKIESKNNSKPKKPINNNIKRIANIIASGEFKTDIGELMMTELGYGGLTNDQKEALEQMISQLQQLELPLLRNKLASDISAYVSSIVNPKSFAFNFFRSKNYVAMLAGVMTSVVNIASPILGNLGSAITLATSQRNAKYITDIFKAFNQGAVKGSVEKQLFTTNENFEEAKGEFGLAPYNAMHYAKYIKNVDGAVKRGALKAMNLMAKYGLEKFQSFIQEGSDSINYLGANAMAARAYVTYQIKKANKGISRKELLEKVEKTLNPISDEEAQKIAERNLILMYGEGKYSNAVLKRAMVDAKYHALNENIRKVAETEGLQSVFKSQLKWFPSGGGVFESAGFGTNQLFRGMKSLVKLLNQKKSTQQSWLNAIDFTQMLIVPFVKATAHIMERGSHYAIVGAPIKLGAMYSAKIGDKKWDDTKQYLYERERNKVYKRVAAGAVIASVATAFFLKAMGEDDDDNAIYGDARVNGNKRNTMVIGGKTIPLYLMAQLQPLFSMIASYFDVLRNNNLKKVNEEAGQEASGVLMNNFNDAMMNWTMTTFKSMPAYGGVNSIVNDEWSTYAGKKIGNILALTALPAKRNTEDLIAFFAHNRNKPISFPEQIVAGVGNYILPMTKSRHDLDYKGEPIDIRQSRSSSLSGLVYNFNSTGDSDIDKKLRKHNYIPKQERIENYNFVTMPSIDLDDLYKERDRLMTQLGVSSISDRSTKEKRLAELNNEIKEEQSTLSKEEPDNEAFQDFVDKISITYGDVLKLEGNKTKEVIDFNGNEVKLYGLDKIINSNTTAINESVKIEDGESDLAFKKRKQALIDKGINQDINKQYNAIVSYYLMDSNLYKKSWNNNIGLTKTQKKKYEKIKKEQTK